LVSIHLICGLSFKGGQFCVSLAQLKIFVRPLVDYLSKGYAQEGSIAVFCILETFLGRYKESYLYDGGAAVAAVLALVRREAVAEISIGEVLASVTAAVGGVGNVNRLVHAN
jgi:hypothetical protein